MNSKEAYRPVITEGVLKQSDISFLRYILPDENFDVEVVKSEGDFVSVSGNESKLPKGYALIRIYTQREPVGEFGEDLSKVREQGMRGGMTHVPDVRHMTDQTSHPRPDFHQIKDGVKSNQGAFRSKYKQKPRGYERVHPKYQSFNEQDDTLPDNKDSLGYFQALNLNASELERLTEPERKKKIKTKYWEAASKAHPDHGGNNEAMVLVNRAMEIISNPSLRISYQSQTGPFAPKHI